MTTHDVFAALADATPELRALAASVGLDAWIGPATLAIAKRLAGAPVGAPGPLGALWLAVADAELRLLEIACAGEPLRAAACAVSWISHVLRCHGAHAPPRDASPSETDSASDTDANLPEEDEGLLRQQLEHLLGRRVPDHFPIPAPHPLPQDRSPLALGSALREHLQLDEATAAAIAAARACDEVMLTLGTLVPGLGWDFSTGTLHQTVLSRFQHLSALLGRLPVLRRIADELGRVEAMQRRVRRAEQGGREAVIGVRVGGELSDTLTCELALLSTVETEDLFFQRFIEHRLLCLELQGTTTETAYADEQRGPAIACVDTSGSMQGAPEAVAKALILAVIRQLVPKGRSVQLLLFGGPGEAAPIEIQRGSQGLNRMLDFLRMGFHAGTDYDTPLLRAMDLLKTERYAKADVLVVTDGLCRASSRVTTQVAEVKHRAGARVLSVVVGGDAAGVDDFSDHVWIVDPRMPLTATIDFKRWQRILLCIGAIQGIETALRISHSGEYSVGIFSKTRGKRVIQGRKRHQFDPLATSQKSGVTGRSVRGVRGARPLLPQVFQAGHPLWRAAGLGLPRIFEKWQGGGVSQASPPVPPRIFEKIPQ